MADISLPNVAIERLGFSVREAAVCPSAKCLCLYLSMGKKNLHEVVVIGREFVEKSFSPCGQLRQGPAVGTGSHMQT